MFIPQFLPSPSFVLDVVALCQGYLMKLNTYASQGELRYFRLEDGFLTCYEKRLLDRTRKNEV